MEQGGRVDKFDNSRKGEAPFPPIAAHIRRDQQKKRTEPLAAAADEVIRYFGNQGDIGIKILLEALFQKPEIRFICLKDILHFHGGIFILEGEI
jgi:hypothetical protein